MITYLPVNSNRFAYLLQGGGHFVPPPLQNTYGIMGYMQIIVDGIMTNYVDVGAGKTLLILHGWGSNATMWGRVINELAKENRVIAVDLPGFGKTDEPSIAWKVNDYAEFVKNFLDKIDVKKLHGILGHSFGGRVIIDMLDSGWNDAKKIIFVDSAGVKHNTSKSWRSLVGNKLLGWARKIKPVREFIVDQFGSDDYRAATPMMREILKLTVSEDKTPQIERIRGDVMIIWGENDKTTPLSDVEIFRRIENSRVEIVAGAGHSVYLEKQDEVVKLIKEFL